VKLHVLSDIHLEFAPFEPPATDADAVLLAGDIWVGPRGVEWAVHTFDRPVIYVLGNHEYYGGHFKNTLTKMKRVAAGTNVHVLDGEGVILDGVRFLAATLWTDFAITGNPVLAQVEARQSMTDYRRIRAAAYRRLRPSDTRADHLAARTFLQAALSEPFQGTTVVVTHHGPARASIAAAYQSDRSHLNASYVSDLEALLGPPVLLWVHGPTHFSFDYRLAGTRVVCNPRGYLPYEPNAAFDPGLVVEIAA
jgi:predicted MPP superfamily phosphohydrolase